MTTSGELIRGALRLIGVIAEGEVPSLDTMNDSLVAFNQMLDSWSTERLSVYTTQDQIFTWPPGEAVQTLGPTGDFIGNRPFALDDATYFKDPSNGISYGIKIINQQQYNGIAVKTVTSTYPQVLWINEAYPNADLSIYPVPTRALEWHFVSVLELANAPDLVSPILFPQGYKRAFRYNLACELAGEFGVEPAPSVARIAMVSKRNLKRVNNPGDIMAMPYSLVGRLPRFNVYSGNY